MLSRALALAALLALLVISFSGLHNFGLVGPDEPRYASIGREMAHSGDWVTPRLWNHPWFEKPALLYWMIGASFAAGLGTDLAPRAPVAALSVVFLGFYFWWLRREFNGFVAAMATAILASSAMWIAYSHAAVTDIPLTVTFAAAILLAIPAVEGRPIPSVAASALLGLSVVAKGLVPLVLALPVFWFARRHWRVWLKPWAVLAFAVVTLPWYVLCTLRNGPQFLTTFFWQHQFGRFTSPELQHVQPFWFYLPWLVAAFFPSIFFTPFAFTRVLYRDRRRQCLAVLIVFGLVFFSVSRNKLPGYILPLLPFACILIAAGADAALPLRPHLLALATALSMLLVPFFMIAGGLLPAALAGSLHNAYPLDWTTAGRVALVIPIAAIGLFASLLLSRERALLLWFALVACGWVYLEYAALPWVDQTASARSVWLRLPEPKRQFCVGPISRAWRYGLNYYAVEPLPGCAPGTTQPAIVPNAIPAARPVIVSPALPLPLATKPPG